MHVRPAEKHEEVWLLDRLDEFGMPDPAFRSRDYVFAVDEETGEKAGFGRLRVHSGDDTSVCELTNIGVLPDWRGRGVGAHVIERLVESAQDQGFDRVFSLTTEPAYLEQFGFERIDESTLPEPLVRRLSEVRETEGEDAVPLVLDADAFSVPGRLRRRFRSDEGEDEPQETAEDFGIDADTATYKYDTGG
ncbi:GNAT family N-acetyltransferase [Salarchaeum japonicum]|nr:GNAT family N-acetyltransferase [Salarchaeum japonicum]